MNAAPAWATPHANRATLRPEYAALTPDALLAHFRAIGQRRYFPVLDPDESSIVRIDDIVAGGFSFNGERHALGARFDWLTNPSADVEWHILLHKQYYAAGLGKAFADSGQRRYAERWIELTRSWIEQTPIGFIAADVTGRRVQNWIYAYWYFVLGDADADAGLATDFHESFLVSLEAQVDYLCAHLTPKRNHRTLELYAIFLAGVAFPELQSAEHWRQFGLSEFARNISADLLPDGVHCELSTDYHHLVLRNALCVRRLAAMNGVPVPPGLDADLQCALEFSMHAHKPDGVVPSFSDGDARGFLELLRQGHELYGRADFLYVASGGREGQAPAGKLRHFANSGYVVARSGWGTDPVDFTAQRHVLFDCGPLGEGNHGHFDCLSFELAAGGRSLIVDPGRYTYSEAGDTNWRVHFRSTAAHNTITVDGRNQTCYEPRAVASGTRHRPGSVRHRIGGPAPIAQVRWCSEEGAVQSFCGTAVSAEYDAVHTRCMIAVGTEYLLLVDQLEALTAHTYDLRLQLAGQAAGRTRLNERDGLMRVESPDLTVARASQPGVATQIDRGHVSCRYGHKEAAPVIRTSACATNLWLHHVLLTGAHCADRLAIVVLEATPADDAARLAPRSTLTLLLDRGSSHDLLFVNPSAIGRWQCRGQSLSGAAAIVRFLPGGITQRLHQVTISPRTPEAR